MSSNPLVGIRKKLARADDHVESLDALRQRLIDGYRDALRAKPNSDRTEFKLFLDGVDPFPSDDFGPLVGDIVHNLRSALDHLAWSLTVQQQGFEPVTPLPAKCWWRQVGFPIYGGDWSWESDQKLRGIDPEIQHRLRDEQPFTARKGAPHHPLWVLEELWNRDKHRALIVVLGVVGVGDTLTPTITLMRRIYGTAFGSKPRVRIRQVRGPVQNGKEVATVEFGKPISEAGFEKYFDKYLQPFLDIVLDESMPGGGRQILMTLGEIRERVRRIVDRFGPELKEGPYPVRSCPDPCLGPTIPSGQASFPKRRPRTHQIPLPGV